MNKLVVIAALVLLFMGVIFIVKNQLQQTSHQVEEVHMHAGFQVYKDNTLQDYSGAEFMKLSPCLGGENTTELTPEEEQLEKAHLHDNIGNVVHVHRKDATWGDLFQNANIELDEHATAYINDQQADNIFTTEIKPYDSIVVFQGKNANIEEKLAGKVTRNRIIEVENMSENCGS